MKVSEYREFFPLTGSAIDSFSKALDRALTEIDTERLNRLRIRLSMEEALLRMRDHFGEDKKVHGVIQRRFGRLIVQVEHEGEAFNPLSLEESELEDLCSSLLTSVGLSPQYTYNGRTNLLRIVITTQLLGPFAKIVVAVIGGVILGNLGGMLFPDAAVIYTVHHWMDLLYTAWSRVLNVMMGPILFFMVITTILNTVKISERGGDRRVIIGRYFIFSLIMGALATMISCLFYPLKVMGSFGLWSILTEFIESVLQNFPKDFMSPFAESNTPQLLVMALTIGAAMNIIGDQGLNLARICRQINMVGLQLCSFMSRMVPFVLCILMGMEIWVGKTRILTGLWICIIISLAVSLLCIAVVLLYVSMREQISPMILLRKLAGPFWLTLRSGSLDTAFGVTEQSCMTDLGMNRTFTSISLPNGLVLYMPISSVGTLIFIGYAAMHYNIEVSWMWYVQAVIFAVIVFAATPPVPGANLLAYIATFAALGIPGDALIDAMLFDIIFGLFASAANQMLLQLEMILQCERMGLLNQKLLHRYKIKQR